MKTKSIILSLIIILAYSCKRDDEPDLVRTISYTLVDIIEPPALPAVCSNPLLEPKAMIKNTNIEIVDYINIQYGIFVDTGDFLEVGPVTEWYGTLNPGEEIIITCEKWDTAQGFTLLENGIHS